MKYAQTGEALPAEFRDGAPANTDSLGATIPTTVLNEFINLIRKRYGNLYAKTRKLNIKGAVKVPIAELQASFKWISESTVSPRQDGGEIKDFVEFSYNMAEIRVSQSLLSSIVTIDLFEREIVNVMMIAYMQAMDSGIVNGTGNGQMLGILNDPRVTGQSGHIIELTAAEINNWTAWKKKFFAKIKKRYKGGKLYMAQGTFESYVDGMVDQNGQPVARTNYGISGDPTYRFGGKDVETVEEDILSDFETAATGEVFAVYMNMKDYVFNSNMVMTVVQWTDHDTNKKKTKVMLICDGKAADTNGIILLKKKV
jgi:HK97 family phage major capsid protein